MRVQYRWLMHDNLFSATFNLFSRSSRRRHRRCPPFCHVLSPPLTPQAFHDNNDNDNNSTLFNQNWFVHLTTNSDNRHRFFFRCFVDMACPSKYQISLSI